MNQETISLIIKLLIEAGIQKFDWKNPQAYGYVQMISPMDNVVEGFSITEDISKINIFKKLFNESEIDLAICQLYSRSNGITNIIIDIY